MGFTFQGTAQCLVYFNSFCNPIAFGWGASSCTLMTETLHREKSD